MIKPMGAIVLKGFAHPSLPFIVFFEAETLLARVETFDMLLDPSIGNRGVRMICYTATTGECSERAVPFYIPKNCVTLCFEVQMTDRLETAMQENGETPLNGAAIDELNAVADTLAQIIGLEEKDDTGKTVTIPIPWVFATTIDLRDPVGDA
jgi:hypothetical protein